MRTNFSESNPEFKTDELPDADYFHNNETDANRLATLIVSEKKASRFQFILFL
jgi:hypothetical protein